jgi:predicted metal-binding membrane protein
MSSAPTHSCAESCSPSISATKARGERWVWAAGIVVFAATVLGTWYFCRLMPDDHPMKMPGGWTMSCMWMTMPGQRLLMAGMFMGMWTVMMVAMMLPSSLPMLLIYRRAVLFRGDSHANQSTALLAAGYFLVWAAFGAVAYAFGLLIASATMKWDAFARLIPVSSGIILIVCGVYQLTGWKTACLRHCRDPLMVIASHLEGGRPAALRLGLHQGAACAGCCVSLMVMELVLGIMNIPLMIGVAVVIALEKLLPWGNKIAKFVGIAAIVGGATIVLSARKF